MLELPPDVLSEALQHCSDGVCLVDPETWRAAFANRAFRDWAGSEPIDGQTIFEWLPALVPNRLKLEHFARQSGEDTVFRVDAAEVRARMVESWLAIYLRPVAAPPALRLDPLTGLADRTQLLTRINELLSGNRASDRRCAVLFVDVDGFKHVNDTFGHLVGDRVLIEVAQRLAACVRAGDLVARFGGDEFVVLLEAARGPVAIEPVITRIRAEFDRPIALPEGQVTLAVSIGAAEAGPHPQPAEALINAADRAMYAAKRAVS